jgi:hypothetical protein
VLTVPRGLHGVVPPAPPVEVVEVEVVELVDAAVLEPPPVEAGHAGAQRPSEH